MKRRKPPYVLGGILFAAFCGVIMMGIRFAKYEGDPDQPQTPPQSQPTEPTLGVSRNAPSPKDVSKAINSKPGGPTGAPTGAETGPATVLNQNHISHKAVWDETHPGRIGSGANPDTSKNEPGLPQK